MIDCDGMVDVHSVCKQHILSSFAEQWAPIYPGFLALVIMLYCVIL